MRLIISPFCEVSRVCRAALPSHLVRLVSPEHANDIADLTADSILTLTMHDVPQPSTGWIAPDHAMIQKLIEFSSDWSGERPLVAQCWAGVSRSTAAAFVIACQKRPDAFERDLAAALRRASPQASPNPLIVTIADTLLGRSGRMIAAIADIGRGAEFAGFEVAELNVLPIPRS